MRCSRRALLVSALVVGMLGCGLTGRHVLGPTIDTEGRVGVMYTVSVGPMLRCDRKLAVPAFIGLGAKTAGLDGSHFSYELGAGADWVIAAERGAADAAAGAAAPRWGKRLGLRAGYLDHGDTHALTLGLRGALTIPATRRHLSLGLESGCEAMALRLTDGGPRARCQLGLVVDLTNPEAFGSGPFY